MKKAREKENAGKKQGGEKKRKKKNTKICEKTRENVKIWGSIKKKNVKIPIKPSFLQPSSERVRGTTCISASFEIMLLLDLTAGSYMVEPV